MVKQALVYFAVVFGFGFALGTMRVLWVAPVMGERNAELAETPLMLLAIFFTARWVVHRYPLDASLAYAGSGVIALGLMLGFEFLLVLELRGLPISDYLASRDPLSLAVYAASLIVFAGMPWVVRPIAKPEAR